jgi:hypothetical protein
MATLGAVTVSATGVRGQAPGGVLQDAEFSANGSVFDATGSNLFVILENVVLSGTGNVAAASRTGSLSQTLAQALLSAPNGIPIIGTAGPITLGALSLAARSGGDDCFLVATGTVANTAGGGLLANLQSLLRGSAPATGSFSKSLDAATSSGAGAGLPTRTGDLSITLDAAQLSTSSYAPINGYFTNTLANATLSTVPAVGNPIWPGGWLLETKLKQVEKRNAAILRAERERARLEKERADKAAERETIQKAIESKMAAIDKAMREQSVVDAPFRLAYEEKIRALTEENALLRAELQKILH